MNTWKKTLTGISLIALSTISLVGCGQKNSTSNASSSNKVKIEYWYGLGSEADKTMKSMVKDFNDSQDKYEVKPVAQPDYKTTYQKLQAGLASRTAPALALLETSPLNDLGKKNALTDLSKTVKDFNAADYLDVFLRPAEIKGKTVGIPAYGTTQVMYYRKDLFKAAGIDAKKAFSSWEELIKASKTLQASGKAKFGFEPMWGADNLTDIALSNGGSILSTDGKKVMINSKSWVESWNAIRKAIHTDKTMKITSGGQGWEYWYKSINDVLEGTAGGYIGSSGDKGNLDFKKIDSAQQPGFNHHQAKPGASALYFVSPASVDPKQQAAAAAFIKFFTASKQQVRWAKAIGYIPTVNAAAKDKEYTAFTKAHPYEGVPFAQALHGTPAFVDPTGGKIQDALKVAADKIELENIDAKTALDDAQKSAQAALDAIK